MAVIIYQCETIGCGATLVDPDTKLCTKCENEDRRKRPCPLCGNLLDPARYSGTDNPVCCGGWIQRDFFRGYDLTGKQLKWVYGNHDHMTAAQREIALQLAARFHHGEESVSGSIETPWSTYWQTGSGLILHVTFSSPWTRQGQPVESIEIGWEYEGLSAVNAAKIIDLVHSFGSDADG